MTDDLRNWFIDWHLRLWAKCDAEQRHAFFVLAVQEFAHQADLRWIAEFREAKDDMNESGGPP